MGNDNYDFQSYTKKHTRTDLPSPCVEEYYYYYLPDEIWFKIFLLLPLESIHKNKCVSKQWLSLLSDSSFLKTYYKVNTPLMFLSDVLCFNGWRSIRLLKDNEDDSNFVLNHDSQSPFDFLRFASQRSNRYYLDSSNGCVLFTNKLYYHKTYFIGNPLTRKRISLERKNPKFHDKDALIGFISEPSNTSLVPPLLLSSSSSKSGSRKKKKIAGNFMVVRVPFEIEPVTDFTMEIFYSELCEWKAFHVSCPQQVTFKLSRSNRRIVKCNGMLYWFVGGNKVLTCYLNDNTKIGENFYNRCNLISLPDDTNEDNRYLGDSDGLIYYSQIKISQLSVWVLVDQEWRLVHKSTILDIQKRLEIIGINPFDPNVLFIRKDLSDFLYNILSYNITTGRFEVLRSRNSKGVRHASSFVLVTWPTIL